MRGGYRWLAWLFVLLFCAAPMAHAENAGPQQGNGVSVMEEFHQQDQSPEGANRTLSDKDKRRVMFMLGIPLLVFILITAVLGISMVVYGKQVFMAHMIFAGLSVTLAIVHVVVGFVWFNPF